jgi:hypothetical protein
MSAGDLNAAFPDLNLSTWGHSGPCKPGCTCIMAASAAAPRRVLPCLTCGSALEPIAPGDWQPHATIFYAHGNYGSGVFDPDDGTALAVNVCDACMAKAGEDGRVELVTPRRQAPPAAKREPWTAAAGWDED